MMVPRAKENSSNTLISASLPSLKVLRQAVESYNNPEGDATLRLFSAGVSKNFVPGQIGLGGYL